MAIGAISSAAAQASQQQSAPQTRRQPSSETSAEGAEPSRADNAGTTGRSPATANLNLSEQDLKLVEDLKQRDREVRAHEQAHVAASGGLAKGGPTYTFRYGPDGRAYAVGGEVDIDTSPGRTPEESIQKARQIRAAALAPAEPSAQDRAVAAQAAQLEAQARQALAAQQQEAQAVAAPAETAGAGAASAGATTPANQQAIALYGVIGASATPGTRFRAQA